MTKLRIILLTGALLASAGMAWFWLEFTSATTRPARPPVLSPHQVSDWVAQLKLGNARAEHTLFNHFALMDDTPDNTKKLAIVARDTQNGVLQFLLFQGLYLKYECKTEKLVRSYEVALAKLRDPNSSEYNMQKLLNSPRCLAEVGAQIDQIVDFAIST